MSCNLFETTGWTRGPNFAADPGDPSAVSATPPTNLIVTEGYRGIRIMVLGNAANDDTDITIYGVERSQAFGDKATYFIQAMHAVNSCIVGTTTGVDGSDVLGLDEGLADAYDALTSTTYGTTLLNYVNGTAVSQSSGANGVGGVFISDIGNLHGIVIVPDTFVVSNGTVMSYLWKLDR